MPIREYQADEPDRGCRICRARFERFESLNEKPLLKCPQCRAELVRLISTTNVGASQTGADDRAQRAGFHKLKKLGRGEYEKIY